MLFNILLIEKDIVIIKQIKLEPNQFIYVSIDNGHQKFLKFKRNYDKYLMRLVFYFLFLLAKKITNFMLIWSIVNFKSTNFYNFNIIIINLFFYNNFISFK